MSILNPLDIIFIILSIILIVKGTINGFLSEFLSTLAVIGALFGAVLLCPVMSKLLADVTNDSKLTAVFTFLLLFIIIYILVKLLEKKCKKKVDKADLDNLDRALGLFYGILESIIIIEAVLLLASSQNAIKLDKWISQSYISQVGLNLLDYIGWSGAKDIPIIRSL